MKKFMTWKVWLLVIALILAVIILAPNPWADGIEVVSVDANSDAVGNGLNVGDILISINDYQINDVGDVDTALASLIYSGQEVKVRTSDGFETYDITNDILFEVDENLTISDSVLFEDGSKLLEINGQTINDYDEFNIVYNELVPKRTLKIVTEEESIAYLTREIPKIVVSEEKTSNLVFGLEFTGGTRVLLKPIGEDITDDDITTLIDVLSNRLNVYGLSDIKIRSAEDWDGNRYVLVELAGVTQNEVRDLISQQGKFEAKIGEDVVFSGGNNDIPYVCRNDGTCSGVRSCEDYQDGTICEFEFSITLSPEAAQKQADLTSVLDVVMEDGKGYLELPLDLYLDGELVDSLRISESLKGQATTQIAISGSGSGATQDLAIDNAYEEMKAMQTILITGSLPFDIEIAKMDTVSPVFGKIFFNNMMLIAILAIVAVALIIFIRYRKIKFVLPVMGTMICEIVLVFAFAALINWNIDMAAIAGILAAIGTGVDDQIVIIDEAVHGKKNSRMGERMKRAFFIIFAAFAATVAAMLPLLNAGAGLFRGFALTTIAGVTIGVFLTRPAFASIIEAIDEREEEN
ncbi:PDZ domain-containing protein [Candidatus Woesearchaeota archaeon]|nr:PDZ domain-containing protein [Candidatus Woesearchaeota archaeon]